MSGTDLELGFAFACRTGWSHAKISGQNCGSDGDGNECILSLRMACGKRSC